MIKVTYESNVLTVVTNVSAELAEQGYIPATIKDENGNDIYRVAVSEEGNLTQFGISCNAVVDGNLALVLVAPVNTPLAEIKRNYGKALVACSNALTQFITETDEAIQTIDNIFEN